MFQLRPNKNSLNYDYFEEGEGGGSKGRKYLMGLLFCVKFMFTFGRQYQDIMQYIWRSGYILVPPISLSYPLSKLIFFPLYQYYISHMGFRVLKRGGVRSQLECRHMELAREVQYDSIVDSVLVRQYCYNPPPRRFIILLLVIKPLPIRPLQ